MITVVRRSSNCLISTARSPQLLRIYPMEKNYLRKPRILWGFDNGWDISPHAKETFDGKPLGLC